MALAGAVGAIASGAMGMMQANYQAKVAEMNAEVAEYNAKRAAQRGGIEAQEKDVETRALLAEQEVGQAASGVSLSGKSQVLTRDTARLLGTRDRLNIIENAATEKYNHLVQKSNFQAEAKAAKMSGKMALLGGFVSALGSLPTSEMGGAKGTAAEGAPVPKPKPAMAPKPASATRAFVRPKNYINPLTRAKMGTY